MDKIEEALKIVRPIIASSQTIDMEVILDSLYSCGIWLNETEISICSKKLQEEFKVLNVKDL
jgi:hypothetical protein